MIHSIPFLIGIIARQGQLSSIEGEGMLDQDGPLIREGKRRDFAESIRVDPIAATAIEVVSFPRVITDPEIGNDEMPGSRI